MSDQPFSNATLEALMAEADAAGIKGASKVAEAVRKQLTEIKRGDAAKVPDNRARTYYMVGVAWCEGHRLVTTDTCPIVGLSTMLPLFHSLYDQALHASPHFPVDIADPATLEEQNNSVRANLTRKGEGHFQLQSVSAPLKSWLDVFVYLTEQDANTKLEQLKG